MDCMPAGIKARGASHWVPRDGTYAGREDEQVPLGQEYPDPLLFWRGSLDVKEACIEA